MWKIIIIVVALNAPHKATMGEKFFETAEQCVDFGNVAAPFIRDEMRAKNYEVRVDWKCVKVEDGPDLEE